MLLMACFAKNSKVNETTGYSPFELAAGFKPRTAADNFFPGVSKDDDKSPSEKQIETAKLASWPIRRQSKLSS